MRLIILFFISTSAWAASLSSFNIVHTIPDVPAALDAIQSQTGVSLQPSCRVLEDGKNKGKWISATTKTVLAQPCSINGHITYNGSVLHIEIYQELNPEDLRISSMTVTQALQDQIIAAVLAQ